MVPKIGGTSDTISLPWAGRLPAVFFIYSTYCNSLIGAHSHWCGASGYTRMLITTLKLVHILHSSILRGEKKKRE